MENAGFRLYKEKVFSFAKLDCLIYDKRLVHKCSKFVTRIQKTMLTAYEVSHAWIKTFGFKVLT